MAEIILKDENTKISNATTKEPADTVAEDLTDSDKAIIEQHVGYLDCYTKTLLRVIPKTVIDQRKRGFSDCAVKEPCLEKQA